MIRALTTSGCDVIRVLLSRADPDPLGTKVHSHLEATGLCNFTVCTFKDAPWVPLPLSQPHSNRYADSPSFTTLLLDKHCEDKPEDIYYLTYRVRTK